jgi:hypothetical protein
MKNLHRRDAKGAELALLFFFARLSVSAVCVLIFVLQMKCATQQTMPRSAYACYQKLKIKIEAFQFTEMAIELNFFFQVFNAIDHGQYFIEMAFEIFKPLVFS